MGDQHPPRSGHVGRCPCWRRSLLRAWASGDRVTQASSRRQRKALRTAGPGGLCSRVAREQGRGPDPRAGAAAGAGRGGAARGPSRGLGGGRRPQPQAPARPRRPLRRAPPLTRRRCWCRRRRPRTPCCGGPRPARSLRPRPPRPAAPPARPCPRAPGTPAAGPRRLCARPSAWRPPGRSAPPRALTPRTEGHREGVRRAARGAPGRGRGAAPAGSRESAGEGRRGKGGLCIVGLVVRAPGARGTLGLVVSEAAGGKRCLLGRMPPGC